MKKCPYCAEKIHEDSIVCPFCGKELSSQNEPTNKIKTSPFSLRIVDIGRIKRKKGWTIVQFIIFLIGFFSGVIALINNGGLNGFLLFATIGIVIASYRWLLLRNNKEFLLLNIFSWIIFAGITLFLLAGPLLILIMLILYAIGGA